MEDFLSRHELQLYGMSFPQELHEMLYTKLTNETFDSGSFFSISQHVNENNEFLSQEVLSAYDIPVNSQVILIDHAWTTRIASLRDTLQNNYKLLNRLKSMVKIRGEKFELHPSQDPVKIFEDFCMDFDDQGLNEVPVVMEGTLGLSLWGNNFESIGQIESVLSGLKALWLNENPISKDEQGLFMYFEQFYPDIEILNSKFTSSASEWAMKYVSNSLDLASVIELDLSDREISRASPSILGMCPNVVTLDISRNKLTAEWETALFQCSTLKKLKVDNMQEDWAWRNLKRFAGLKYINEWDTEKGKPELVDHVIAKMWAYFNCYRLSTQSTYDENAVWYILDEFGSSILHSDAPNCKLMPFLYYSDTGDSITYSLLWPIKNIRKGEIIYRDFLPNVTEQEFRSYRLCPWFQIPQHDAFLALSNWHKTLAKSPFTDEFLEIPPLHEEPIELPLRIATDLEFFENSLTDKKFALTDADNAQVLWTRTKVIDPKAFVNDKYLNQFPYETCIVMKNMLAQTVQKAAQVPWFPLSFDLNHEFSAFMGEYLQRQKSGQDNHWIIKPINMSRGIDCVITNSLDFVSRLIETGPKIAQKYIERPFLLDGRKNDMRFIVLLKSVQPLSLYIYNHFWIRSANVQYTLSHTHHFSYETHFTVMNYSGHIMRHIKDHEFVSKFENSTNQPWATAQGKIYKAIKELFTIACRDGKMHREKSRAIYGIDIILDSNLEPQILEVNFCPDCERAVKYYPEFTNQVFNCLFFGSTDGVTEL
ncbi:hypothetical protein SteCoe_23134 [Stentor coeruleus]|uniref:Tubulin--tyrosine ligase-like protein 12 SET-like domain-containing protein n=1 Tax=Stentor coeruleus TaxID=5963 RepID=A0A1R2BKL8_9CILI|nr:hypothetical protein SteCoe_23134 [Stentor coeruleus]